MAEVKVQPNVGFKMGTQAALNKILKEKTAVSGTFYLTNDTHRLYVGQSDKSIAPVNQGITTVANVSALAGMKDVENGAFCYATLENVLCIKSGESWVQINPDTNTTYTYEGALSGTTYSTTLKENGSDGGGKSSSITFKGSNGISISGKDSTLTINGADLHHKISLSGASDPSITLKDKNGNGTDRGTVKFTGGENVTITGLDNNISIVAKDTKLKEVTAGNNASNTTGFFIKVTDDSNDTGSSASIDPKISIGGVQTGFKNGVATLNAYSKTEVDKKLQALDGMTYKGVWSNGLSVPTEEVHNGDTWRLGVALDIVRSGSSNLKGAIGDLLIAHGGSENGEGIIPSPTAANFDVIESGNEDTTYAFITNGNGFTVKSNTDSEGAQGYTYQVNAEGALSAAAKEANGNIVTITHNKASTGGTVETTKSSGTAANSAAKKDFDQSTQVITAVVGLKRDEYGHIATDGVITKEFTIRDTNAKLEKDMTITAEGNVINMVTSMKQSNDSVAEKETASGKMAYTSTNENLVVSATADTAKAQATVSFNLVWGTF